LIGFGIAIAGEVLPRPGSEADLGPNVAAVIGIFTILTLGVIVLADHGCQAVIRAVVRSAGN
jgi:hypothetical protein